MNRLGSPHQPIVQEDTGQCSNFLQELKRVQETIDKHKVEMTGIPESLRVESATLKKEVSRLEIVNGLEDLKARIVQHAESKITDNNLSECQPPCQINEIQGPASLVFEAESADLEKQIQNLAEAVEGAKKYNLNLETEKMRLKKEMMELQLLLGDDRAEVCKETLSENQLSEDNFEEASCQDSPRITTLPELHGDDNSP